MKTPPEITQYSLHLLTNPLIDLFLHLCDTSTELYNLKKNVVPAVNRIYTLVKEIIMDRMVLQGTATHLLNKRDHI